MRCRGTIDRLFRSVSTRARWLLRDRYAVNSINDTQIGNIRPGNFRKVFLAASRLQTDALELSLPQTVFELSYCTLCDCPPFRLKSIRASSAIHNYYYYQYWSNTVSYYSNVNGNVLLKSTRTENGLTKTLFLTVFSADLSFGNAIL